MFHNQVSTFQSARMIIKFLKAHCGQTSHWSKFTCKFGFFIHKFSERDQKILTQLHVNYVPVSVFVLKLTWVCHHMHKRTITGSSRNIADKQRKDPQVWVMNYDTHTHPESPTLRRASVRKRLCSACLDSSELGGEEREGKWHEGEEYSLEGEGDRQ